MQSRKLAEGHKCDLEKCAYIDYIYFYVHIFYSIHNIDIMPKNKISQEDE